MRMFLRIMLIVLVASLSIALLILSCDDDDDDNDDTNGNLNDDSDDDDNDDTGDDDQPDLAYDFPPGFLFGAATAGFQVDMGCPSLPAAQCADTNADWYAYVTDPDVIARPLTFLADEDPNEVGPGHWELFEDDFDLAKNELKHNAFRMSIEWSRIFPQSTVDVEGYDNLLAVADADALAHYHSVFDALRERGLQPLVTLHHYTMPTWLHDAVGCTLDFRNCERRGWLDAEVAVREIAKYAGFCAREFGGDVDLWATQNEPFAVLLSGYLLPTPTRSNPPARVLDGDSLLTAYAAMIDAHARMYDAIKEGDTIDADNDGGNAQVGLVYAVAPVRPHDAGQPNDQSAAENVFYMWNTAFLDAVALGMFDSHINGEQVYREDLAGRMDFIGLNYKVRIVVDGLPFPLLPWLSPLTNFNPITLKFDEVYPQGIYDMAHWLQDRYGVPIHVTENNGQHLPRDDVDAEVRYLVEHFSWLAQAIDEGVDVRSYFYWALMDNYEWNRGMHVPLGLYEVDPLDPLKTRIARPTVPVFAAIAEANGVPVELAEQYPIE